VEMITNTTLMACSIFRFLFYEAYTQASIVAKPLFFVGRRFAYMDFAFS
jgi:hypothetical protein